MVVCVVTVESRENYEGVSETSSTCPALAGYVRIGFFLGTRPAARSQHCLPKASPVGVWLFAQDSVLSCLRISQASKLPLLDWWVCLTGQICVVEDEMRRVVVTGLGAVTPLGVGMASISYTYDPDDPLWTLRFPTKADRTSGCIGVCRTWQRLLNGDCGIVSTRHLGDEFKAIPSQVAGLVPTGVSSNEEGSWRAKDHVTPTVRICPYL